MACHSSPLSMTEHGPPWRAPSRRQVPDREDISVPPSTAAEVAYYTKIGGGGIAGIGALDAALEPAGGLGGVIG